jgi:hypothetical protein
MSSRGWTRASPPFAPTAPGNASTSAGPASSRRKSFAALQKAAHDRAECPA